MSKSPRLSLRNRVPDLFPAQTYAAFNHFEARGAAERRRQQSNHPVKSQESGSHASCQPVSNLLHLPCKYRNK